MEELWQERCVGKCWGVDEEAQFKIQGKCKQPDAVGEEEVIDDGCQGGNGANFWTCLDIMCIGTMNSRKIKSFFAGASSVE